MKILHLISKYAPAGGIETYVLGLLPHLEARGHENQVLYRQPHPRTVQDTAREVVFVPESGDAAHDRAEMITAVRRLRPDVIYLHDLYDPEAIAEIAQLAPVVGYVHIFFPVCPGLGKLFRRSDRVCDRAYGLGCIPKIYTERCATARHPRSVLRIMRQTGRYLDAYRQLPHVAVGSAYMQGLMAQNGIAGERLSVLPLFVPLPPAADVAATPMETEPPIVFFAGRLEYEKGVSYLLQASSLIDAPHRLMIAGDGSLAGQLKQQARDLAIAERVQFIDWLAKDELFAAYRRATVTVMPTLMPEPFGLVGVEAMANGRPVVAFAVGGIPDWLVDGETGYLAPPANAAGLAQGIARLVADPQLAARLGRNARQRVADQYNADLHVDRLLSIFDEVLT